MTTAKTMCKRIRAGSSPSSWACIALTVFLVAREQALGQRPDIVWMRGGHSAPVRSLACSPDGKMLATASDDWTAKLWRVEDRQMVRTLVPYIISCSAVAFSPDGAWLAVGTDQE